MVYVAASLTQISTTYGVKKMNSLKAFFCLALLVGSASYAATTSETPAAPAATASSAGSSSMLLPSVTAPKVGPFTIKAKAALQNTAPRGSDSDIQGRSGRYVKIKNEYSATAMHDSGWGLQAMGVQAGTYFRDSSINSNTKSDAVGPGDSSLTLIHPAVYQTDDLKVWGQFRRYFARTERTRSLGQEQYAYYLFSNYKMAHGLALFNQLTPRYFSNNHYAPTDSKLYAEDYLVLTQDQSNWFKYGVGAHSQIEGHEKTATGGVIELYPLVDFVLNQNIFIEPRVYLPIYKHKEVYDSPTAVSLNNAQAELFMQISM
jgi:hypothetical protein